MQKAEKLTGLVLSGGGARGFAHLGILQALNEYHIKIDRISGVSAGAIAAAFYSAGYTPLQILDLLTETSYIKFFKLSFPNQGFLKNTTLFKLLKKMLPEELEQLNIPVTIALTNLNTGKIEYHNEGPLARIVLASTSIPVVFHPVVYNKYLYADGGIMNNFPIEPLLNTCNNIIGSHVNPISNTKDLGSLIKITERSIDLAVSRGVFEKSKLCDLFIEPAKIAGYKIFDFKKSEKLFDLGYEAASKLLETNNIQ